jgi:hypothetical protein
MKVGLKPNSKGVFVERLHRVLATEGLRISSREVERSEFGTSTLDAVHELQRKHGLEERDEIDEPTHAVLIELEQKINIDIDEGKEPPKKPPTKPHASKEHSGTVNGKLVDVDGAPLPHTRVSLFSKRVRGETPLDGATTDKQGQYKLHYRRPSALNIVVRAYNESVELIAESATVFAAPAEVTIDLSTAPGGVVRNPSILTTLSASVAAQLQDIPLSSLKENKDTHELRFLANAAGAQFDDVAYLYIANILGTKYKIQPPTFFGLLHEGVPASLNETLRSLPDTGIDDALTSQVMSGILAQSHNSFLQALNAAVAANVLPASYAGAQAAELALLDTLRLQNIGNRPYAGGTISLNDLFAAGEVTQAVQSAFVQAYAKNNEQLEPTLATLRENEDLPVADLDTLDTTLSLGELLTGNIPLISDTLSRLSGKTLASPQDLALLDENDWIARITDVDPDRKSIPSVTPGDTPEQRIAQFATSLAARFTDRYPTTAFVGGLSKAKTSAFRAKDEMVTFITSNPKFEFKTTSIDQYIVTNKTRLSSAAVADLKTAQRLFRISPSYSTVEAMKAAGHLSAQSVYFTGRDNFVVAMTASFGSAPVAEMAFARAEMTYAATLTTFARYNSAFNRIHLPVMASSAPDPDAITNLPDLQALFGSLDSFECEECQSVFSPAAYLVDLLQYLKPISANGHGVTDARDALLLRRPDIQYIALDCNNTNIALPYIDLVNEILEAAIAPPDPPATVIETTGTSEERRAIPQQILQPAYALTGKAVFPLILPFDLPFAQTTAYIGALGTTRAAVLGLFAGNPVLVNAASLACASLQINPEMQKVINGSDTNKQWERWGLAEVPASVIDPETRNIYVPNPPNWVAALSKVPVLLNRTGLSLLQLYQLLEVAWVTESAVTLKAGITTIAGVDVLSPSLDDMVFIGLTDDVLDRANRFLRLWSASGLQMWEVDWALEAAVGGALDDSFLVFLANSIAVQKQLKLPIQELLSFWMPLETRDVINHLGAEDSIASSTYSKVFRNPAVLMSSGDIFIPAGKNVITGASNPNGAPIAIGTAAPHGYETGQRISISGVLGNTAANGTFTIAVVDAYTFALDNADGNGDANNNYTGGGSAIGNLSDNPIIPSPSDPPTAEQIAITASLGLDAEDIAAILAFTGEAATAPLTLDTLNVLFRFQRLSSALSLDISELILWIQLTNGVPFGPQPGDTLEFLRCLAVLQATGVAVRDLDYLLRDQSASQSSLAFTQTQATTLLQTIRDAIAKLPTPITGASNVMGAPIAITTAAPHSYTTGQQVSIVGVLGNTAANGTFTITLIDANTFSLDGTAGNGDVNESYAGGGLIISADTNQNIQTLVVASLETATSSTANVVTQVLARTGVLPLDPDTIDQIVRQTPNVDPTQFPTLIDAFTSVAKAAALFTALKVTNAEFTFLAQNAATFGWLDLGALPVNPASVSPYTQLEALLMALRLNRRQPARFPRLFDILGQWLQPNALPADLPTAIGGPTITITAATNDSPIAVTTAAPHGLQSGEQMTISGVAGNRAANGTFRITVADNFKFTLDDTRGNGVYTGGGTVTQPSLAFALASNVNDVLAIANALHANTPDLTAAKGSLADMAVLAAIATALDVCARYGISGSVLVSLAAAPATADTASAARGALQAQYAQSNWFGAIQPVEDVLRQQRRDALVAYILGPGPAEPVPSMLTTDDIYDYYLIDPEMCPCAQTTRLLEASLAIQQFVQQCFLNLFFSDVTVDMSNSNWSEWSWRKLHESWKRNRMIFLYPENYLLPETRKDASSFFNDLENDLRQSSCDANAAQAAIENYLRKLVAVSQLQVAAHYNQARSDGSTVLHVFAHTSGTPPQWYYRTRTGMTMYSGSWSAWQQLNLDIASQHLMPVIWDQRLFLVWPVFKQISEKQSSQTVPDSSSSNPSPPQDPPQKFWTVEFAMSELSAGQWQPKQTLEQKLFFDTPDSPLAFTFLASQSSNFNLQLQIYFNMVEEAISLAYKQAEDTVSKPPYPPTTNQDLIIVNTLGANHSYVFRAFGLTSIDTHAWVRVTWQEPTDKNATSYVPIYSVESSYGIPQLVATGTLPMPESPLSVAEWPSVLPDSKDIDLSREPTFATVSNTGVSLTTLNLPGNYNYGFSGQDLVYGNYTLTNTGKVELDIPWQSPNNPYLTLLQSVTNPRIIVSQQELPQLNSLDPFFVFVTNFVIDPASQYSARTYLVQPVFYTDSSYSTTHPSLSSSSDAQFTKFRFDSFYHPYARTLLRELEIGGVPRLMARALQLSPQTVKGWALQPFDFSAYSPNSSNVAQPYPGADGAPDVGERTLDFAVASSGAYSLYNWEVFYHIPMFIASLLLQNQQFQDAITWLEYIFNPTDSSGGSTAQHYWQMAPFYNANQNADGWNNEQVQYLLTALAVENPAEDDAIQNWVHDPFDSHAVASTRISAYAKATVMKFLDVLIAYGDWYYSQDNPEMVSQAEQLYILADMILGPEPQMVRLPDANRGRPAAITYASLKNTDLFSNVLVSIENIIVGPEPPHPVDTVYRPKPSLPPLSYFPLGTAETPLFCIPFNKHLLGYWKKVEKRLYNIRHCLNLQGAPLPQMLNRQGSGTALNGAQPGGAGSSGATTQAPIYRFAVYLQKAIELTNDVRAYGSLILSALEKQDAEALAALRASQELDIQTRMLDVKTAAVTEAQDQIAALNNQKAQAQIRYDFYSTQPFMNAWETAAIALQAQAIALNIGAIPLDLTAAVLHLFPSLTTGVSGFGGTPQVNAAFSGEQFANAVSASAGATRAVAGIMSEAAAMAVTTGGYQHRANEWSLQANLAQAELTQIDSQITAAQDRQNIAQSELSIQNALISNSQAVSNFLTTKYTNAQLYNWMITELTSVHTQAYQLAFSLAQQAQSACWYELGHYPGSQDPFIQFGYWNSQYKGLTAGESLLFDLRRMEAQYLSENSRELELTKRISLALTSPLALVRLRETGVCDFELEESLYDYDHPGQYFRRLRSVAITIPCVTGPYTGVNATLTLGKNIVRTQAPDANYQPQSASVDPINKQQSISPSSIGAAGTMTIATSSGQADMGLFEDNLHDERWRPFEGQGAICSMNLVLDPRDNNFDFTTITDVVLTIRYTARAGGDPNAAENVRKALQKLVTTSPRSILVSLRHSFPGYYHKFFNPPAGATELTLTLPLTNVVFPFSNLANGTAEIQGIAFYVALSVPAGDTIPAQLSAPNRPLSLDPPGQQDTDDPIHLSQNPTTAAGDPVPLGNPISLELAPMQWKTNANNLVNALSNAVAFKTPFAAPQTFTLMVQSDSIPAGLAKTENGQTLLDSSKIEDILLVISYSLS